MSERSIVVQDNVFIPFTEGMDVTSFHSYEELEEHLEFPNPPKKEADSEPAED